MHGIMTATSGLTLRRKTEATKLFASSALFLSLGLPSFARIGETMDEAITRYGNVVRHDTIHGEKYYSFEKNGFHILAHFHDGKLDRILYNSESRDKLTEEEIDTFLRANNGGRPMNEDLPYIWVGKDVAATYSKWHRHAWHLDIKARSFGRRKNIAQKLAEKAQKEAEKAKLEGF
jgi:hypothetical protein